MPSLSSSLNGSPRSELDLMERFSRKVFVGGLPPDIDEGMYTRNNISLSDLPQVYFVICNMSI